MLESGIYIVGRWLYIFYTRSCGDGFVVTLSCHVLSSVLAVNGYVIVMWIGQQVSGDVVSKLFGVSSQAQINMDMVSIMIRLHFTPILICT